MFCKIHDSCHGSFQTEAATKFTKLPSQRSELKYSELVYWTVSLLSNKQTHTKEDWAIRHMMMPKRVLPFSQFFSRLGSVSIFAPEVRTSDCVRILFWWNWIINAVWTCSIRVALNNFLASGRVQCLLRPARASSEVCATPKQVLQPTPKGFKYGLQTGVLNDLNSL